MKEPHQIFAALADPTRVRILLLAEQLQLSVGELAEVLDQSQPRVSRHVRLLAEAGLVERRKEGAYVFVRLLEDSPAGPIAALIHRIYGQYVAEDFLRQENLRLQQVRSDRQQAIDDWFQAHADEWDLFRQMAGQEDAVDLIIARQVRNGRIGRLLDIGTGTGRLLAQLAPWADSATGVDRSPEMLRLARGNLTANGTQTADLVQADMLSLPFADAAFDTIILQHVLHFTDSPVAALQEMARILAPGGRLIIADYAAHDHEELRTELQHRHLGFEEEALLHMLAMAGLSGRRVSRHDGPKLSVLILEGQDDKA